MIDPLRHIGAVAVLSLTAVVLASCGDNAGVVDGGGATEAEPGTTRAPTTSTTQPPATTATTRPATTTIEEAGASVSVVEGEPYRQPSDGIPSTVDIYVPDEPRTGPAVALLHGWATPGRDGPDVDLGPFAEQIARLGATVFYFRWHTTGGFAARSAADLSCIGGFMGARAADHGADPTTAVVIGHSMGGETGSKLALSSFGLTPGDGCVETSDAPAVTAFLGIGGTYGLIAQPLDDDLTMFAVRATPRSLKREIAADEFMTPGLTARDAYQLDGHSALPSANPLRMVLLVGSNDQYPATNTAITAEFAAALQAHGTEVEVIEIPGANHENVMYPDHNAGKTTLQVVADILSSLP